MKINKLLDQFKENLKKDDVFIYNIHDRIFYEGDVSSEAYLVLSGEIELVKKNQQGKEILISRIAPNEIFGIMGLINDNWIRPTTAIVFTDNAQLVKIYKTRFDSEILKNNLEMQLIIAALSDRLMNSYKRILHFGNEYYI